MSFLTAFTAYLQICSHKALFRGESLENLPWRFICMFNKSNKKVTPLSRNVKRNQNKRLSPSTLQGQTDRVEA